MIGTTLVTYGDVTVTFVKPRYVLRCLRGACASLFIITSSPVLAAPEVDQSKINDCLAFQPSEQMKTTAVEITQAVVVGAPWARLAAKFKAEVQQVTRDRCAVSDGQLKSADFDSVTEGQLLFRSYMAINNALGGRMVSPQGRPSFDSGSVAKCLFKYSQPLHKALVMAAVHEKLSGSGEEPGYDALSAHLRAIGKHDCSLTTEQMASPEFRVTIADYIYDASFELILPLFSAAR